MDKTIKDTYGDPLTVCSDPLRNKKSTVRVGLEMSSDGHTTAWFGDRTQLRDLIEALRRVDAEQRTEHEVIVRRRADGSGIDAVGLEPGDVHEHLIMSGSACSKDAAKVWWSTYGFTTHRGRQFKNAPVTFVGFDDDKS